ncbi:hypothetical protein ACSS6W_008336 [Trichoderma asperelloides]
MEELQVVQWLTQVDYGPKHSEVLRNRQSGTGLWFLHSTTYQSWLKNEKQTLFHPGGPGSGKTVRTSIVINDLEMRFQTNPTVGIAYIYCDYRRQDEQEIEKLTINLLTQLIKRRGFLPECVREIYNRHKDRQTRPSLDEILTALHSVVKTFSRVFIIVDAIDECQAEKPTLDSIINALEELEKLDSEAVEEHKAEQFTDSGYNSRTHRTLEESESFQNEEIKQDHINTTSRIFDESTWTNVEQADDGTEYSAATSLSDSRIEGLVSQLADQLIGEAYFDDGLDERSIKTVCDNLQNLIKVFALKIGLHAQSQIQRDIMYYSHKYSETIVQQFEMRLHERNRDVDSLGTRISPETTQEMTRDWLNNLDDPGEFASYEIPDAQGIEEDQFPEKNLEERDNVRDDQEYDDEGGEANNSYLGAYRGLISESAAYGWLLAALRRELLVDMERWGRMKHIKDEIMDSLQLSRKISKSRPSEVFHVTFSGIWHLVTFLEEQKYHESLGEAIERVITLTGSAKNAQALTTLQYLRQIWPTTGEYVLQLVKDVLRGIAGEKYTCHLPEGTELIAWIDDRKFVTEVSGTRDSIAEIGQQLAWLRGSLSSTFLDTGIEFHTPLVHNVDSSKTVSRVPDPSVHFWIECMVETRRYSYSDNGDGECWRNMFRNPVLVKGFPVLRRPQLDTGIEMPLHMMSALVSTHRIDEFNGKLFIKGFSTMLIPTHYTEGVITWHLLYNQDGNHISYLDACTPHISIKYSDLEKSRNIVGWCSQADLFADKSHYDGDDEKKRIYRFQDLVDDIYNILEKMIVHQSEAANQDGVRLKSRVRKHLDGWEFDDIVENEDCRPRVATLEVMGHGWVNFIEEVGAVVLLGKDFGEIIRPSNTERLCDHWSQMPVDEYYLGACVSDLANIIRFHGDGEAENLKLTNNISWHSSDRMETSDEGNDASASSNSKQILPVLVSTSGQRDSNPGHNESQTEASAGETMATSLSNTPNRVIPASAIPSKGLGEAPSDKLLLTQEAKTTASQENDGMNSRQRHNRRDRWKKIKQRVSYFSK